MAFASLLIALSLSPFSSAAQTSMIGKPCPDFTLNQVVNGKLQETKISDLRGTPLIIEYWASWCSVCRGGLPKLDSLQKQFPGVRVLLVSSEKQAAIQSFFQETKLGRRIGLPSVTGDTAIKKAFRFRLLPNVIWIDKDGIVQAITDNKALNQENLQKLLAGATLGLPEKKDVLDFNVLGTIPLLFNNYESNKDKLLVHSAFTGYQHGITGLTSSPRVVDSFIRCRMTNAPIEHLYLVAYNKFFSKNWGSCRVLHEYSNPRKYVRGQATTDKYFCYDLYVKGVDPATTEKAYQYMRSDLDRLFELKSSIQKRTIKCLVLRRTSSVDKLKTKGEKTSFNRNASPITFYNATLSNIISKATLNSPYTVFDETGYTGPVDLEFDFDLNQITLEKVRNNLARYDLELVEEQRELDVIVLQDL